MYYDNMSTIAKGTLTVEGNSLHLSMPFQKVNKAKRTVSGFATLDNIDTQGDKVLAEASLAAFQRARGNLREMHKKDSAVGRIVNFREETLADEKGKEYRGIFVTARVSEGAQDTWLKVLDGTLSGFSIGGEINKADNEFNKDAGKTVRVIEDYDLTELSLVDNPANPLANVREFEKNIFSMQKSADGSVTDITGMVADTQIENVFICKTDDTIIVKDADSAECPICDVNMENAGWFETGPDRAVKVRDIVTKFLSPTETEAASEIAKSEGGEEMGTQENTTEVQTPENVQPAGTPDEVHVADVAEPTATVDETEGTEGTEKPADVEEVQDDETEIAKKINELHTAVEGALEKTRSETTDAVKSLEQKIAEVNSSFEKKFSELDEKLSSYDEKLETAKARTSELEKSLNAINSSEAFKKSADLDGPVETVQKSDSVVWTPGTFSHAELFRN
jgi:phage head maturation protease